uniref:Reverse transcriptase domain-containing protein n=1 Tax=Xenopus tropicalis TaxID=8364 RepID=A0A803K142_XENTR
MTSRDVSDAPFRARSDFGPVTSNTSLRTFSRIIDSTVSNIPRQTQHRGNLNKEQRVTLKGLQENRNIIVKPADKGGAVVVMDYEYYRTELLDQLADTGCYQKLTYDPTSKFQSQLGKLLDEACLHGWITEELRDALYVEHPVRPVIYTLPKIHKNLQNPPARPIISARGSLAEKIAKYVDTILQPLVRQLGSYLQDTTDFLRVVNSINAGDGNFLFVTMDVHSLYTCIPHDAGIHAVRDLLSNNPVYTGPPVEFILTLLEFILHNNYFKFEDNYFLQLTGTAMGSNVAPTYANIFMYWYETCNIYCHPLFRKHGVYFRHYIDDRFFLWYGTDEDLLTFVNDLNGVPSSIRFTVHRDKHSIDFLDVTVYKDSNNQLHTKIFQKPTDRNSLLHYTSSHPRHLLNSLPKSQMLRVVRITSKPEERQEALEAMAIRFLERGYPTELITGITTWAKSLDREAILRDKLEQEGDVENDVVYYMTTYDAHTPFIKKSILQHWPIVKTDAELTAINRKRVRFGYKRNKNLKELLSSADPVCKGVATLIVFYSKEKHFGHMNWIAWLLGA